MHRRVTFLMSTLVVVALATAACSGGGQLSHDEYQQKLTQIASDFKTKEQSALGALGGIQSPNDLSKAAPAMNTAADDIDGVANQLDGLNPPDDAADANAKLVSGFHGIADAFREFAKAAEAKDLAKLQSLGQSFQNSPAAKELSTASSELKKAGYKVPNNT
jgi:hypothetical protein